MMNKGPSIIAKKSQYQNVELLGLDAVLLLLNGAAFAVCWFAYYENHLYLSFEGNGNYMVIGLFDCA